jgi:galactonate dehydratase
MKITRLDTFLVPPRWLFLRVETDEGVVGWGEPVVEGRAATVRTAVEELAEQLVGQDPLRIEDHWQALYRGGFYRGGAILMSALAGIDQALWDIKGKVHGASACTPGSAATTRPPWPRRPPRTPRPGTARSR